MYLLKIKEEYSFLYLQNNKNDIKNQQTTEVI